MTDIDIPEGFTRWDGGDCPVPPSTKVSYVLRSGHICDEEDAYALYWEHRISPHWSGDADIIAYRVLP